MRSTAATALGVALVAAVVLDEQPDLDKPVTAVGAPGSPGRVEVSDTGMGGDGGLDLLVNHSPNMDRVATCCPRFEGRSARA